MISEVRTTKPVFEKLARISIVIPAMVIAILAAGFSSGVFAADTFKGQQLYAANCSGCHGMTGNSVFPGAPNLGRGQGVLKPDFTLLSYIRAGKNAMPAYQGILSDRDIMDVIAFVRTLN